MSNVRCLSGYITTPKGEVIFSILVNGHLRRSKEIDIVTDSILGLIIQNLVE